MAYAGPDAVNTYAIRFHGRDSDALPDDAADRIRSALLAMPGTGTVHGAGHDPELRIVSGEFQVEVDHGIAEAAQVGARYAKEALKVAGLGDAQLVELWVGLRAPAG